MDLAYSCLWHGNEPRRTDARRLSGALLECEANPETNMPHSVPVEVMLQDHDFAIPAGEVAFMPGSAPDHLTPEIVHTTGGTEITVFGKFDLDDALCWFSDVTRPSVAFNI